MTESLGLTAVVTSRLDAQPDIGYDYPQGMRRADPERIYLARRAATFNRMVTAERMDPLDAEHWIARWEREAESLGIDRLTEQFWQDGDRWIAEIRRKRNGPVGATLTAGSFVLVHCGYRSEGVQRGHEVSVSRPSGRTRPTPPGKG
jgi:hypothetical protein